MIIHRGKRFVIPLFVSCVVVKVSFVVCVILNPLGLVLRIDKRNVDLWILMFEGTNGTVLHFVPLMPENKLRSQYVNSEYVHAFVRIVDNYEHLKWKLLDELI